MKIPYNSDDLALLRLIRSDLVEHPDTYSDAIVFLRRKFFDPMIHLGKAWEAAAREVSPDWEPDELDRIARQLLAEGFFVQGEITRGTLSALRWFLQNSNGSQNNIHSRSILLLALLLWDEDGDSLHPSLAPFGTWGGNAYGEYESLGRAGAAVELTHEITLRSWMSIVRSQVELLGVSPKSEVTVETGDVRQSNAIFIQQWVQINQPPFVQVCGPVHDQFLRTVPEETGRFFENTAISLLHRPVAGEFVEQQDEGGVEEPNWDEIVATRGHLHDDCPSMAKRFGVNQAALDSRLSQFRKDASKGDGWDKVENPGLRAPRYLYNLKAVIPIIQKLYAREQKRGLTVGREKKHP